MTDSLSAIRHLIDPINPEAVTVSEVYRCPKGNVWELIKSPSADRRMVRCIPNPELGAEPTLITVEEFLAVNSAGPEHAALRILLTTSGR